MKGEKTTHDFNNNLPLCFIVYLISTTLILTQSTRPRLAEATDEMETIVVEAHSLFLINHYGPNSQLVSKNYGVFL